MIAGLIIIGLFLAGLAALACVAVGLFSNEIEQLRQEVEQLGTARRPAVGSPIATSRRSPGMTATGSGRSPKPSVRCCQSITSRRRFSA